MNVVNIVVPDVTKIDEIHLCMSAYKDVILSMLVKSVPDQGEDIIYDFVDTISRQMEDYCISLGYCNLEGIMLITTPRIITSCDVPIIYHAVLTSLSDVTTLSYDQRICNIIEKNRNYTIYNTMPGHFSDISKALWLPIIEQITGGVDVQVS